MVAEDIRTGPRARLLEAAALAARIKAEVKAEIEGGIRATLAAVRVGEDPASAVYVRNKIRACEEVGIRSEHHALPEIDQHVRVARVDRIIECA